LDREAAVYNFALTDTRSFRRTPSMTRPLLFAACLALAGAAAPALAKGDAARGKSLAYTCSGCHGIAEYKNAYPSYRVPKIAGQNEGYLVAALTGYAKGERNHPTMKAQASSFSQRDIADISAYLSGLKRAK
jgi:cytochrome c553